MISFRVGFSALLVAFVLLALALSAGLSHAVRAQEASSEPLKNNLCFTNPADNVPSSPNAQFNTPTVTTIAGSGYVRATWTTTSEAGGGNSFPFVMRVRARSYDQTAVHPCGGTGINNFNDGILFSDVMGLSAQPNHEYAIEQIGPRDFKFVDLTANIQSSVVTIPEDFNTGGGLGFSIEQIFTLNGSRTAVYYFPFLETPSPTPTPTASPTPAPTPVETTCREQLSVPLNYFSVPPPYYDVHGLVVPVQNVSGSAQTVWVFDITAYDDQCNARNTSILTQFIIIENNTTVELYANPAGVYHLRKSDGTEITSVDYRSFPHTSAGFDLYNGSISVGASSDSWRFSMTTPTPTPTPSPTASPTPTPNQPPVAGFTMSLNSQSATEGGTLNIAALTSPVFVNFSANRSSDPDGTVIAWEWKINGTVVSTASNFTYGISSSSVVTLVVTDNGGATSAEASAQVAINFPVVRTAPYDFFNGCNENSEITGGGAFSHASAIVFSDPLRGRLQLNVQAAGVFANAFGRAGVGIHYDPTFTGQANIRAVLKVGPGSDVVTATWIPIAGNAGIASIESDVFITAAPPVDSKSTSRFRAAIVAPVPDFPPKPIDTQSFRYNPAQVYMVDHVAQVVSGHRLQICAGVQTKAVTTAFPGVFASSKALYSVEVVRIEVTPR